MIRPRSNMTAARDAFVGIAAVFAEPAGCLYAAAWLRGRGEVSVGPEYVDDFDVVIAYAVARPEAEQSAAIEEARQRWLYEQSPEYARAMADADGP